MANTSISIKFVTNVDDVGAEQNIIKVELDDEYNNNETTFNYGTKAYYRIYQYPDSGSMTVYQTQSDGTITAEGSGSGDQEEQVTFANTNTASSGFPIKSITDTTWLGNDLGAVSGTGTTIKSSQVGVGVLKIEYTADFTRHAISVPTQGELEEYTVIIYINGSTDETSDDYNDPNA
ncbi:MAG: hypothetical protein U9P90_01570 [Patescibacteria group bacterium]|nr:hypothetical protein [Patescibacteria group bacterium]